ncbi:hypothetical protein RhiirA4_476359 [Rhizophagus irregularis]|uniref:Uncharacterized protein n=1 Tax=Rhizophagus irregularis TaxID=588596 RepID=A0A2I1HBM4_9GLOM|nr:hypothetical protein RhiirA4_476359 [Rhizophagus irregularis]
MADHINDPGSSTSTSTTSSSTPSISTSPTTPQILFPQKGAKFLSRNNISSNILRHQRVTVTMRALITTNAQKQGLMMKLTLLPLGLRDSIYR